MEIKDVEQLSSPDENVAREAFDRLCPHVSAELERHLILKVSREQDREEIVSKSCTRIWQARLQFKPYGLGSWYKHIRQVCWWVAIDHLRANCPNLPLIETSKPDRDLEQITSNEEVFRQRMYDLADEVWLEWDRSIPRIERKRRVLAAQLSLLHQQNWEKIAPIVRLRVDQDREKFDDWLTQRPTLLHLSYSELYALNKELCEILLGLRVTMSTSSRGTYLKVEWTEDQQEYIRLRFTYNVESTRISQKLAEETLAECIKLFPFVDRLERLARSMPRPHKAQDVLGTTSLWKRIAFQYFSIDELPYKHMHERMGPAAAKVGQKMDSNTTQAWFGSGRLVKQLRDAL